MTAQASEAGSGRGAGGERPLGDLFDTAAKALAAVAGAATFVYVIGGLAVLAGSNGSTSRRRR